MACILGFYMDGVHGPERIPLITLHISAGITVLALTILRIVWRVMNPPPAFPDDMKTFEVHASQFAHLFIYVAMILIPLSGWLVVSANPPSGSPGLALALAEEKGVVAAQVSGAPAEYPTRPNPPIWYTFHLPYISLVEELGREPEGVASQKVFHDELVDWHVWGSYLMIAVLVLHLLGALKHQFIDKQQCLQRMGLGRINTKSNR